jgi:hypothetical protein
MACFRQLTLETRLCRPLGNKLRGTMELAKLLSSLAFTASLWACGAECQTLAPVDISAFGKHRPIQAAVTNVTTSECRGSAYFKAGTTGYDDLSYDVHLSGNMVFKNRSRRAVMLYKDFDPAMTERVAVSPEDAALGKYVAGLDGDRMAISGEPKKVSIDDFVVIKPGESYTATIRANVRASVDVEKPLHNPGKYWIQLGVDARPDEFYFNPEAEKDFRRKWQPRGYLVEFILADLFSIEIRLDPNAPACKD